MDLLSSPFAPFFLLVLAASAGWHAARRATPALRAPLAALVPVLASLVVVGAMLAAALTETALGQALGEVATALATASGVAGLLAVRRALTLFRRQRRSPGPEARP